MPRRLGAAAAAAAAASGLLLVLLLVGPAAKPAELYRRWHSLRPNEVMRADAARGYGSPPPVDDAVKLVRTRGGACFAAARCCRCCR